MEADVPRRGLPGRPGRPVRRKLLEGAKQGAKQDAEPGQGANARVLPTASTRKLQRSNGASRHLVRVPEGFEQVDHSYLFEYAKSYKGREFDTYICNSKESCIELTNDKLSYKVIIDSKVYKHEELNNLTFYLGEPHLKAVKKLIEERKKQEEDEEKQRKTKFMNELHTTDKISKYQYNKYIKATEHEKDWICCSNEWEGDYGQGKYVDFYKRKPNRGGSRRRSRGFMASLKKVFGMTRRVRRT